MLVILNVDWLIGYACSFITIVVVATDFAVVVVVAVVAVAVYSNFDIF